MTAGALLRQADINKSITELWNKTYKGSDIDGIQIKTEDEGCTSDGRRKQSYRVVMRKGDTSLDMRGRCSAGQKACWRWHLHASPPVAPYIAPYTSPYTSPAGAGLAGHPAGARRDLLHQLRPACSGRANYQPRSREHRLARAGA